MSRSESKGSSARLSSARLGPIRRLIGMLGASAALLLAACNQPAPPAGTAEGSGAGASNPYAGGVSYPWSDRLDTAPVGSNPYAGGVSYPWVGAPGSGALGKLALSDSYLSDLSWTSATNAWGPVEKDRSNAEQAAGDGRPLTIGGVVYPKGLGVHAGSTVVYTLSGTCSVFSASVGIDDEVGNLGSVNFQVYSGSSTVPLYDSGTLRGSDGPKAVSVPITGVTTLRLVVTNGGDNIDYDHADWGNARVSCESSVPAGGVTQLSTLGWQNASNGWGPIERNLSNGEQGAGDGRALTIGGVVYAQGLGVHATSEVSYPLAGTCSVFSASVGIDDEVGDRGSVNFQVYSGSSTVPLYDSGTLRGSDGPKAVSVPITGVTTLRLVVTNGGDNIDYDHADWGDAKITCGAADTTPPTVPTALTGSSSPAGVSLDWADNTESDLAGYLVYRGASAAGPFTLLTTGTPLTVSAYLDALAPSGSTLYYQVVAVDRSTNASGPASVSVTSAGGALPSLSAKNLSVLPSDNLLVFHTIRQNGRNTATPNVVHDTGGLRLSNAGPGVLRVTALDLQNTGSGPYTGPGAPVAWSIDAAPTLPFDIAPGASLDLTVRFIGAGADSDFGTPTRFDGLLNVVSNDAAHSPLPIKLAGLWQTQSENNVEPSVYQIVSAFGYATSLRPVSAPGQDISYPAGRVIPQSPDEVISAYWQPLTQGLPVQIRQIAAFHNQGKSATLGWFSKGNRGGLTTLFTHDYREGQSLLPHLNGNLTTFAAGSFTPVANGSTAPTFGLVADFSESSDPTQNNAAPDRSAGCPGPCGNHMRFFQIRGEGGQLIPGQYLVIMDYSGINYDFQDNVYIMSNVRPAPLLINVGGAGYTDPAGQVWQPDKDVNGYAMYTPGDAIAEPAAGYSGPTILGTTNPQLYTTYRSFVNVAAGAPRILTFSTPLGDGLYDVKLHLVDLYWTAPGQRVYTITLRSKTTAPTVTIPNVDIVSEVGPKTALVKTISGLNVQGGKLSIELNASVDFGAISGIEVLRQVVAP